MTAPERRTAGPMEIRLVDGAATISGYAAVFNTETNIGDLFREAVHPDAFNEALGRDDVRLLFNHDPNQVLARTKNGSLRLSVDGVGLRYEASLDPTDPDVARLLPKIKDGRVSESSFGFRVTAQEWKDARPPQLPLRIVRGVELFDVSPVTYPAYASTTVEARDVRGFVQSPPDDAEARLRRLKHDD